MNTDFPWHEEGLASPPPRRTVPRATLGSLPAPVEAALWRADQLADAVVEVVPTGFAELDAELPGGGWPCRSITDLLQAQPAVLEWRLLAPALRVVVAKGQSVIVVSPPRDPHLPGLRHAGLDERHLVWIKADAPAQRLWCTEQLIKSGAYGALLAWLPQARPEQIRRLQVCAQASEGPVFLIRPAAAKQEASAAPLRIAATIGADWELRVQIVKRRGPVHEGTLVLPSIPGGLAAVLTPRNARPSRLISEVPADVVGGTASSTTPRRHAPAH
ncbi:MAG TPA: translesion DNA synthesis-associated protein ImuA [Ramlibacter sp.]|nr:translesion DNA synthesis-associated protein ImuA [Ramlibacter sp.]